MINIFKKTKKESKIKKVLNLITLSALIMPTQIVLAADTSKLDNLINNQIVPWVQKGGLVIGFVGALMFAAGWRNDDADSKARGVNTLISGFMIAGIATGYRAFVA